MSGHPMSFLSEAEKWSRVAYHCAYDETLLRVLIDSLLSNGMKPEEAQTVLSMALETADEQDEDSRHADALDALAVELAEDQGGGE